VILVCENNGFAEFTPRSAHTKIERVSDAVAPYGFARETVDGNDAVAVHEAFGRFLAEARTGAGPFLLECLTQRLRGHYEGDPQRYRLALAREEWQRLDPILRLQRRGSDEGWLGKRASVKLEREARAIVDEAEHVARSSPFPSPRLPAEFVYAPS
jgi:pyruvate dehydrogenase E1 component alpha subunit